MNIALISDVHSNLEALQAVLKDMEKHHPEQIICLGDVVGYGADPSKCLAIVKEKCDVILMGNHDSATIGHESLHWFNAQASKAIVWTREQLSPSEMECLAGFVMSHRESCMEFSHAAPRRPGWGYLRDGLGSTALLTHDNIVFFMGHTHVPGWIRRDDVEKDKWSLWRNIKDPGGIPIESTLIYNVGSVGQPRDGDPRACYSIIDTTLGLVSCHRIAYDIEITATKIRRAGLPEFLAERLFQGR